MQIEGRVFSQIIQDTNFPDPTSLRKTFKLCTRLGGKILKAVDDVINDVASDVIFHMKKLLLNPFLHIKGGKYEGFRFNTHERASSGLSKNRSRFANRPSWAELWRAQSRLFSSFPNEIGTSHYG